MSLSPSQRELHLVVRLLLELPVDVHRTVFDVGLYVGVDLLRVKESHRRNLSRRTHQGVFREQVAGLCAQLAAHHFLVEAVVAEYAHAADVGLLPLGYPHLKVDGVAHHVDLGRRELIEKVAVVPIVVAHGVFVFLEALLQALLVVHIALLHAEQHVEVVGRHHGVAHPCYVAYVVFLPLVNLDVDVYMVVVVVPHAVLDDDHVAVSQLVVLVDQVLLVGLVALFGKLLRLKERRQLACLVRLGEGTLGEEAALYLLVRQVLVAHEVDVAHLHLVFLVDIDVEYHLVLGSNVVALLYVYLGILVSLLVEILLGQYLSPVYHVRRDLASGHDAQPCLEVFALRLLQAVVVDGAHPGPDRQVEAQVDLGAHNGVDRDGNIREQAVPPIALHRLSYLRAGHCHALAHRQARDAREDIVLVALYPLDGEPSYLARARCAGVRYLRFDNLVLCRGV